MERGLPVDSVRALARNLETAAITASEIMELVIPRRTLDRRRRDNQSLRRGESDKLLRVARLLASAEGVFANREKAISWLRGANRSLGSESPLAMVATETGARLVETMLHQIDHGTTA